MILLFLILIFPPVLAFIAAYFIYSSVRKTLITWDNKHVKLISLLTFFTSFLLIICVLYFLIATNVSFER
jgi:phosphate/sulfate permease